MTQPSFPALLHTVFPVLRLLVLVPLYPILVFPRVSYLPASSVQGDSEAATSFATEGSGLLVPAAARAIPSQGLSPANANQSEYGTFRASRSAAPTTGTNTRAHTPAPSDPIGGPQVNQLVFVQSASHQPLLIVVPSISPSSLTNGKSKPDQVYRRVMLRRGRNYGTV